MAYFGNWLLQKAVEEHVGSSQQLWNKGELDMQPGLKKHGILDTIVRLTTMGVEVVSCKENLDTGSPPRASSC
jgi:hypothetical protein